MALQTHQLGERSAVAIFSDGHPTKNIVDLGQFGFGVIGLDLSNVLDNARWPGSARDRHDGREAGLLALSADLRSSDLRRYDVFFFFAILSISSTSLRISPKTSFWQRRSVLRKSPSEMSSRLRTWLVKNHESSD